jgi:hypothetical protein
MRLFAKHRGDQAAIDPWSAIHFSSGLATGLGDVSLGKAVAIAVASDLLMAYFTSQKTGILRTFADEPPINKVIDVALFAFGNHLGRRWND